MANPAHRLPENAAGDFFVDASCIDCDTCRQLAPATFRDHGEQSSVYRQPETAEELLLARMALVACPTGSIGAGNKSDARQGINAYPFRITENIYYCGFNSEKSFGAWSYLIVRAKEKGGNVLVDSPRFSLPLVKKIESLGGIRQIFLTHRDDVADHARFADKFGAARIMHAEDGAARLGVEKIIEGNEPFRLDEELTVIPVPGHTRGSICLLDRSKFLFSGDHLAWSPERQTLTAFRGACWFSWSEQTASMEKLLDFDFEWVLPGHGRIAQRPQGEMRKHLRDCVGWMRAKK